MASTVCVLAHSPSAMAMLAWPASGSLLPIMYLNSLHANYTAQHFASCRSSTQLQSRLGPGSSHLTTSSSAIRRVAWPSLPATIMSIIWSEQLLRGLYTLHGPPTAIKVSNASPCLRKPAFLFRFLEPTKLRHVPLTLLSPCNLSLPRSGHPFGPTSCASGSRYLNSHL